MNTENKIITKIAEIPVTLDLNGNHAIALVGIAAAVICLAMLLDYSMEFNKNGVVIAKSEPNSDMKVA